MVYLQKEMSIATFLFAGVGVVVCFRKVFHQVYG